MAGSEVTLRWARYNASRVALPATTCAVTMPAHTMAVRPQARAVRAQNASSTSAEPTLINLGFEWVIKGDDNRNAKVEVSYRKNGDKAWKTGHAAAAAAA